MNVSDPLGKSAPRVAYHSYMKQENKERPLFSCNNVGFDLSSRAVASQVFSALQSLTSVFGMGTGGPSALKALTSFVCLHPLESRAPEGFLVHLQGFEPGTH